MRVRPCSDFGFHVPRALKVLGIAGRLEPGRRPAWIRRACFAAVARPKGLSPLSMPPVRGSRLRRRKPCVLGRGLLFSLFPRACARPSRIACRHLAAFRLCLSRRRWSELGSCRASPFRDARRHRTSASVRRPAARVSSSPTRKMEVLRHRLQPGLQLFVVRHPQPLFLQTIDRKTSSFCKSLQNSTFLCRQK